MTAAVSSSSSVLPPVNFAGGSGGSPSAVRGAGFAQMLDARLAQPAPAPAPTAADQPKSEDTAAADHAQAHRQAEEARARQQRANRSSGTRSPAQDNPVPAPHDPAATREPAVAVAEAQDPSRPFDDDATVDPALAEWLSALNLPVAPPVPQATGLPAGGVQVDPALGAEAPPTAAELGMPAEKAQHGGPRRAGPAPATPETAQRQRQETQDVSARAPGTPVDTLSASLTPASFQMVMEQVAVAPSDTRPRGGESTLRPDAVSAAQALSSSSTVLNERPAAEMAAPASLHVPTPVESPEFPQALGAQLSVFAKEGLQHAELHLNPTDMGPISVQIAVEGDQAKVDFGVDSAVTRQIIENGLPELAAALRDAGFTLSGGGVHSQAQQQGQRERDGSRAGVPAGERERGAGEPVGAPPVVRHVRAGGVDLYA